MLTQEERNSLAQTILETAIFYGKYDLSKEHISIYISTLDNHFNKKYEVYFNALLAYKKDSKNKYFPSPAGLSPYINPEISDESISVDTASRVLEAVSKFGWCNSVEARAYVGELGWQTIKVFGGWNYICENLGNNIQISIFNAQARELTKSQIQKDKLGLGSGPISIDYKDPDALLNDKKRAQVINLIDKVKTIEGAK